MDRFKGIAKGGWKPEEGSSIRGHVKGLVGRGEKTHDSSSHVAAPLSSLRDPASFAPPPKRDPTLPLPAPSAPAQPGARPAPTPPSRSRSTYDTGRQIEYAPEPQAAAPPKKWQLDTTGLSTSHLPPPPGRKDGADGRSPVTDRSATPPSYSSAQSRPTPAAPGAATRGPPPSLPPRLPPRSGTSSPIRPASSASPTAPARPPTSSHTYETSKASPGNGFLNQGAMTRLGAAGISVPGFGIGASPDAPPRTAATQGGSAPAPAAQGTSWQQKQAALRTASQFQKDPSSVSFSDAKSAASTANNFRQRHGEQVAGGLQTVNDLGQRFGVTERARVGNQVVSGPGSSAVGQQQQPGSISVANLASALGKKKPPAPPPPKKKPALQSTTSANEGAGPPPPVPLGTRPTF